MTLTKLEVAVHQLDVAIRLFLSGDYLASLTLAGAAEEILGSLCKRAGKPVAIDFIVDYHLKDTDPKLPEEKCWRAFKTDHLCAMNFDQAFC
jgi:hypothetical protein